MARIAKKKTVDNNAGLLKVVVGINRKDVESVTDFGHFFIVILKDCAISTHILDLKHVLSVGAVLIWKDTRLPLQHSRGLRILSR